MKVKEFISKTELLCEHCGKDLLTDPASGIFVTWTTKHKSYNLKEFYQKAYYCCKGACNEAMKIKSRNQGLIYNEQEDLSVYMNPLTYIVYSGPISTTNSGSNGASIPDETEPLFLN